MNLYEIDAEILKCVDEETGEVLDPDALECLEMERTRKIENLALWYKNLAADAAAYKAEKDTFAERERIAKNKAERIRKYLSDALDGAKFQTDRCALSFRRSESVDVDMEKLVSDERADRFIQYEPKVDKAGLKKAIKSGEAFDGATLVERSNIQIR